MFFRFYKYEIFFLINPTKVTILVWQKKKVTILVSWFPHETLRSRPLEAETETLLEANGCNSASAHTSLGPLMPQHQGARDSARDLLHRRHGLLHRARIPHPIPVQARPVPPIPPLLERQSRFQSRRETRLPLEGNRRQQHRHRC